MALEGKDLEVGPASGLSARKVRKGRNDDGPEEPALPELPGPADRLSEAEED